MFDGYPRGYGKDNYVRKTVSKASKELMKISKEYQNTQEVSTELANRFVVAMTKFDAAVQELISRSFYFRFQQSPTQALYFDSMVKMGFQNEDTHPIRNIRKVRNTMVHNYDFISTFKKIFDNESKFEFFESSVTAVKKIVDRECSFMHQQEAAA